MPTKDHNEWLVKLGVQGLEASGARPWRKVDSAKQMDDDLQRELDGSGSVSLRLPPAPKLSPRDNTPRDNTEASRPTAAFA
jgi:hypothetical protein